MFLILFSKARGIVSPWCMWRMLYSLKGNQKSNNYNMYFDLYIIDLAFKTKG